MAFLETYDLAKAQSFKARVTSAVVTYAGVVLTEAQGTMNATRYGKRNMLAVAVMNAPEDQVTRFVWPILANSTIAAAGLSAPDGDITYQISQIWDAMAGVTSADLAPVTP